MRIVNFQGDRISYLPVLHLGRKTMDFYKVPIGFGMALAMNEPAMAAYSAMSEEEKQMILDRAHNARSEEEMRRIVNSITG